MSLVMGENMISNLAYSKFQSPMELNVFSNRGIVLQNMIISRVSISNGA